MSFMNLEQLCESLTFNGQGEKKTEFNREQKVPQKHTETPPKH